MAAPKVQRFDERQHPRGVGGRFVPKPAPALGTGASAALRAEATVTDLRRVRSVEYRDGEGRLHDPDPDTPAITVLVDGEVHHVGRFDHGARRPPAGGG